MITAETVKSDMKRIARNYLTIRFNSAVTDDVDGDQYLDELFSIPINHVLWSVHGFVGDLESLYLINLDLKKYTHLTMNGIYGQIKSILGIRD